MKLTPIFLIPILFLSSCRIDQDDNKNIVQPIQIQKSETWVAITENSKPQTATWLNIKDFWSGFTLSQNDEETNLIYSGKTIKTWSHNPPEKVPFIWDDACSIVWKWFEKLSPEEQSTGKQWVWDALSEKEKKECMKEKFQSTLSIQPIDWQFFEVKQLQYETYKSWMVFSKNGNIQEMPIEWQWNPKISFTNSGISLFLINNYDGNNLEILYTIDFSQLLSKEEIPKNQ